ncbi:hypothetical protein SteCoe_29095 [Stentor coeruleus]|uniref:Uncharacterized protein n=1 Tax=Stentor coeruleus TaxID=5963 RepID=A0A1R2B6U7_9CILI|nr:hypothetical protein SteCoe_29095 [Stentor coeruleus]
MSRYLEERADSIKYDMQKYTETDKKKISVMQAEIKRAELAIQSLIHEKETLKSALASAVRKKEELYKAVLDYKEALEKISKKNLDLENRLDEIGMIKSEIEKVKQQLIRRDEKIEALYKRNQTLEYYLEEQGTETSELRNFYKKTNYENHKNDSDVIFAVDKLLEKVKSVPWFHKCFKNCSSYVNTFRDLADKGKLQEIVIALSKFSMELMKDLEKNREETSPGLDVQQTFSSCNANSQHMSFNNCSKDDIDTNDEERVHKLNLEIKNLLEKSKEVISSRSFSNHIRSPRTEEQSFVSFDKGQPTDLRSIRIPNSRQMSEIILEQPEIKSQSHKNSQKKGIIKKSSIEITRRPSANSVKSLPKAYLKKQI